MPSSWSRSPPLSLALVLDHLQLSSTACNCFQLSPTVFFSFLQLFNFSTVQLFNFFFNCFRPSSIVFVFNCFFLPSSIVFDCLQLFRPSLTVFNCLQLFPTISACLLQFFSCLQLEGKLLTCIDDQNPRGKTVDVHRCPESERANR